jgi:hypothetical protein
VRPQIGFDAPYIPQGEPVNLTQFRRAVRAVQDEHRFTACPDHVDMRGPMIRRIDHDT